MNRLDKLADAIKQAKHIAVLTGAGMSTASGIPDFRSANGLFTQNQSYAEVVSIDYFYDHPDRFWADFRQIFQLDKLNDYLPNAGHNFLSLLEKKYHKRVSILTQNIDGLHTRAGSKEVMELHGTLQRAICLQCHQQYDFHFILHHQLPRCVSCQHVLKPDVVLYGEPVPLIEQAFHVATEAELLLVMGSSLEVGPVNQIPLVVADAGKPCALINLSSTMLDDLFEFRIRAGISETCQFLAILMEKSDSQ